MAVAGFVTDRLPRARQGRRVLPPFIASVLLHAIVLSLLLIGIRLSPRQPEWLPPPAMDMVFEGGAKQAPSVPNPAPEQPNLPPSPPPPLPIPPAQPAPPTPPAPRAPPAPQPVSPPAAPPQETAPPPAQQAAPPQPVPPPAALPQETAPPVERAVPPPPPAPPPPQEAAPAKPAPQMQAVPPPVEAPPIVLPSPPPTPLPAEPVPAPKPPSPAARPAPQPAQPPMESSIQLIPPEALRLQPLPLLRSPSPTRPAPPHPRARPAPHFPAPMAYSFGAPSHADPAAPRTLGRRPGVEMSFAPVGRFTDRLQPDARSDDPDVGPDWLNLVSAWWRRHAWYPPEAGMNNEQGNVTVRLIVAHDGTVESVQLEDRSGKPFLDMGAVAIFRGATLPPLPSRVKAQSIPVHFTIHYIIVG